MMAARSRADVDALNHRSRTAAVADGTVNGPVLAHAAGRDWQSGDLLRTRRNDRRLPVGDNHVRNGDRFTVVASAPAGGLVVDDLSSRGRTVLPADYLNRHATYGRPTGGVAGWRPAAHAARLDRPTRRASAGSGSFSARSGFGRPTTQRRGWHRCRSTRPRPEGREAPREGARWSW